MNHRPIQFALLLALAPFNLAPPPSGAKPMRKAFVSEPRTVKDYFLLLPGKYFEGERRSVLKHASVVDEKNDFLQTIGDGAQAGLTVALFRHRGHVTVAVNSTGEHGWGFSLLRRKNGRWRDVTRALVPGYSSKHFYEIPRYGTTILVRRGMGDFHDEPGPRLYDLAWRGGKFLVRR